MRTTRVLSILALVAASLTAAVAPASADDFSPTVVSFKRASADVLGSDGTVALDFEAFDEGPAGLIWVMFTYRTPLGAELRVDSEHLQRASGGSFIATRKIGRWVASGNYVLDNVEVIDEESNRTMYERDTATQFDWAQADFSVDNPDQDTTVPTLRSARLFQDNVAQGTPVVVLYNAEDDLSGVERVVFYGWNPGGHQYWVESLPQLGAVGPAAWVVPLEAASGEYESIGIQVTDRAGNYITYSIYNGTLPYPPQATVPPHPHPDLATLNFNVFGTTGDRVSPRMTSLSALTEGPRRLGEIVGVRFNASDQGSGIEQIAGQWIDGKGHYMDFRKLCDDLTSGYASNTIEDYRTLGSDWQMINITFGDYLGNQTTYNRDGSMYYDDGGADRIAGTHTFDLSVGDFHLEEGEARSSDLTDTSERWCPKVANVTLNLEDPTIGLGEIVSAFGDVTLEGTPIPDPILAIHEYVDDVPQLIGVVQGGDAGDYVDDFVAETKGRLQATFLGKDGLLGSQRSQSPLVDLNVGSNVTASVTPATIRLGAKASITGRVSPAGDGGRVWLQRRYSWGWKDIRSASVAADGSFAFSVQPSRARTYRYRVLRPSSGTLVATKSRVLTLQVTRS